MQANHTPGPWSIGNIKETPLNPHALAVWSESVKVGEVASPVCIVSPIAELDDTDIQNARLIAAAPDLLEALAACLPYMHDLDKENFEDANAGILEDYPLSIAFKKMKAAIEKATKTGELENY